MNEIELKFRTNELSKIQSKLVDLGCTLSEELNQKDTVFVTSLDKTANEEGNMFVRIREENSKVEITLKKQSSKIMQSKEIEFIVSDYDKAYDFLETLGLIKWVTVEKKRITTKYKGFNICMDEVKRLGQFIEIEIITTENDKTDYYKKEILKISEELGIDSSNIVNDFYDSMIRRLEENVL